MPVKVSPKFWGEHMGMPDHQAEIRQQEVPRADRQASGLMTFSAGPRSFLRYGYGDLDSNESVIYSLYRGFRGRYERT